MALVGAAIVELADASDQLFCVFDAVGGLTRALDTDGFPCAAVTGGIFGATNSASLSWTFDTDGVFCAADADVAFWTVDDDLKRCLWMVIAPDTIFLMASLTRSWTVNGIASPKK